MKTIIPNNNLYYYFSLTQRFECRLYCSLIFVKFDSNPC